MPRLAPAWPLPVLLAGCEQSAPLQACCAPAPETQAPTDRPSRAESADGITTRYACEGGRRVDGVRGETARIPLADGRPVEIPRVADSAPPRYSGDALSFEADTDGATLAQDEAAGFACREAG